MCTLINEQKSEKNIKNQIELKKCFRKLRKQIIPVNNHNMIFHIFSFYSIYTPRQILKNIFHLLLHLFLFVFLFFCFFAFLSYYLFIFFLIFRFFVFYFLFLSLFFIFYFFYFSLFVYLLSSHFFLFIILQRIENIWRGPRTAFLEEHWLIFSSKLKINK